MHDGTFISKKYGFSFDPPKEWVDLTSFLEWLRNGIHVGSCDGNAYFNLDIRRLNKKLLDTEARIDYMIKRRGYRNDPFLDPEFVHGRMIMGEGRDIHYKIKAFREDFKLERIIRLISLAHKNFEFRIETMERIVNGFDTDNCIEKILSTFRFFN